jgi:hypothetical protein
MLPFTPVDRYPPFGRTFRLSRAQGHAGAPTESPGMRAYFIAVGLSVAVLPAVATAQAGSNPQPHAAAPVSITACVGGIASVELVEIAAYDVTFRNAGTVPADEIRLSARYGRHETRARFDLKGTFAPGVDVTRHVRRTVSGGLFSYQSDRNDCDVDFVHFTNGTSWSR